MGLGFGVAGVAALAEASEPPTSRVELGKTRFGMPRLAWSMAPPIQLQPERARVVLTLPQAWMPPPDPGVLGIYIPTTKDWDFDFGTSDLSATATVGARFHFHLTVPSALEFGLSLMPRAAVAILRFDPIKWAE